MTSEAQRAIDALAGISRASEIPAVWARHAPKAPALAEGDLVLDFETVASAIAEVAEDLSAWGVRGGDRVALVTENVLAAPILMFAVQSLGAWPAFINARMAPGEVMALRELIDARLVVGKDVSETPRLFGNRWLSGMQAGEVRAEAVAEPKPLDASQHVGLVLFTSGTTGRPKAVMLSHRGMIDFGAALSRVRNVRPGDRNEGAAPLSHIMGITTLMSTIYAGASLRLTPRLDIAELAAQIALGRVTHMSFVPTVYARLIEYVRSKQIDLSASRLDYVTSGGAPLAPALRRDVEQTLGVRLVNAYGMTECAPIARTRCDRPASAESVGFAEPGAELRIVGEDGRDLPRGEIGELWAKALGAMQGYYRDPRATRETIRDGGWIATGDLGRLSAEGELEIVGRKKEMIIRSGFNVYPVEVEAAINEHPAVLQSAVAGVVRDDRDEDIVAFVQLRAGVCLAEAELIDYLRPRITAYKRPSRIVFREALPLGGTGKILKRRLVEDLRADKV